MGALAIFQIIMMVIAVAMMFIGSKVKDDRKPAGLEDFTFPTAAERPIQVLYGTRKLGGANVLWYGDLRSKEITKKVKSGFSSKKMTIGYKYFMGVQLGICHGPDVTLREVWFDDDKAWSGQVTSGSFTINKPDLFGGEESGGGVQGTVSFYNGSLIQKANAYLQRVVGVDLVSGLRGVCYAVLEQFYIGNTETPAKISFVCSRYPASPGGNKAIEVVGDYDANPAYVIYEFLMDKRFGASISASLVDLATIEACAQILFNEGYGVSGAVDSAKQASAVIDDILKVINGSLVTDAATGKLKLKLAREDYIIADLPALNANNIRGISNFNRGSLDTAINEVKIKYMSISDGFTERTATAQNLGLRIHKGDSDGVSYDYMSISTGALAAKVSQRELRPLSVPLASCIVECNRSMYDIEMLDVVTLDWPPLDVKGLVMRVMSVDVGSLNDSLIKLTLTQDVFGVQNTVYADGGERTWTKPVFEPADPVSIQVVEAPAIFNETAGLTRTLMVLAEQPAASQNYKLITRQGIESWSEQGDYQFTPVFQLSEALPESPATLLTGPIISGDISLLDNYSTNENREALGILYIDGEWLSYETFTILTSTTAQLKNVRRALFGSTAKAHLASTKLWAVSEGHGITLSQFNSGSAVYLKTLVKTQTRRQTEPEATERSFVVKGTNDQVFPPARVLVNGVAGGEISGIAEVSWRYRSGAEQAVVFYTDDRDQAFEGSVSIGVYSSGVKVDQVDNLTGNSWRFEGEAPSNGGVLRDNLEFRISTYNNGVSSLPIVINVTRTVLT
ncbi:phage tail protein [Pseudomonas sp. LH1G9]|uniref:phage tail protein n=1 Tax=Pseudomonas sp. LH1G9 TaxID=2083055 RepID=UPI000CF317C7|nr:phage tail protein [Pseudomonas sp. LH1G9]